MNPQDALGFIGQLRALKVRQGAMFGPVAGFLTDDAGMAIPLTACTIKGAVFDPDTGILVAQVSFELVPGGDDNGYRYWIDQSETAKLTAGPSLTTRESKYEWQADVIDAANVVQPFYYGPVFVQHDRSPRN